MATDEAILRAVARNQAHPTLRLYAWQPGCLSLGRGQTVRDVDRQAVGEAGYDLVRRPTGGRAILHIDELTYSVVAPESDPRVSGPVVESYRRLSTALVYALELLGIEQVAADERVENRNNEGAVCFEVPSDYEITADGKKLVGSAQMRAQGVVLQHGTLPLRGDIARICPLLASRPDPASVRARATTVEETLSRAISWERAARALENGFAQMLNLQLEPAELTGAERRAVGTMRSEKYGTARWTAYV
ncbi:MAG: biotin/lipoate A/B protein ligase family protein [Anaerolineae bacterium]|jgi:lipoate-protein ligase A